MPRRPRMPPGRPGLPHHELEALLERSRLDPTEEPAFFRSLLDATVYIHVPVSDDSKHIRVVQFRHPDGFDAIPFFTSPQKAQFASSRAVRIVELCGHDLLSQTRGATLMLNPNDGGAVLYPEEIASLLDTGFMARVEKIEYSGLHIRPAANAPAWLEDAVRTSVQDADFVAEAYLLESNPSDRWNERPGLVIYLVVDHAFADRAARMVTAAVQPLCGHHDTVIDVMIHDVTQPLPDALVNVEMVPIYRRAEETQ
ncbi:SseB family protein [Pseudoxanthomonas mexicana]|uniref:SseB family protein n=1 Tax=Pseudoxanthomonas mexicana TaxID=128785 RepID=A0ABX6REP8_PSEMX|nr:SseB family protein [Pseudoxanthomonas mexicana]QND81016.1 SseB family protein [Pseudoxanthomonas mexicana]